MPATDNKPNQVLAKMLDRLFAGLMNGPGMNCRPHKSRQRIDLTQLGKLQDISPEEILYQLLGREGQVKAVARVKPPKRSDKPAATAETVEPSPKEKAWDEQTALLNKLRVVVDDARTYEQDTGVHVLNVGFPLLSLPPGSFTTGQRNSTKRILAPIAFIPVTLAMKRGTSPVVELSCRGEGVDRVMPNSALFAWLEQQTGRAFTGDLFSDAQGQDPWREIRDLVAHVAGALGLPIPEAFKADPITKSPPAAGKDEPSPATEAATDDHLPDLPPETPALSLDPAPRFDADDAASGILLAAVLGLFPMANQGLLRDMQAMLAESAGVAHFSGPVDHFLSAGVDFDEAPAPLFDSPSLRQLLDHSPRRMEGERLATAADPCQARAVALARDSRGLVIHGPPGTGKSQTITNIIADHLSRGQRVLLVCEKRTALDVVADRLEHMGLGNLCGIVHDPQRDQRDLYKSIRQQLDDLPELKTRPNAEAQLIEVDAELQALHDELMQYHQSLMVPPRPGERSFHELMGQWLAIQPAPGAPLDEASAEAIAPADVDRHEAQWLDLLNRARAVDFGRNPWAKCAGISLEDFLNRPMQAVRTALQRCRAAAESADATIDAAIPPFSVKSPPPLQAHARAEIAERWESLLQKINPSALARWIERDAESIRAAQQKLRALEAPAQIFRAAALDADLVAKPLPTPSQVHQHQLAIGSYLAIAGKWHARFHFNVKSTAAQVLKQYGLPLIVSEAERLKKFLVGLQARLAIQAVRAELSEGSSSLPPDDVMERFLTQHAELFDLMLRLHEDPALDGLVSPATVALSNPSTAATFIDGLRKSPARAEALVKLEEELSICNLFNADWLAGFDEKLRHGGAAGETMAALCDRLDTLEGILRVRSARASLPAAFGAVADQLLQQSFDPADALASLRKASLAGEILRRLRADPRLQTTDARHVESNFERYRALDAKKKQLVRDAIQHRWVSKQQERLLAGTGTKLNSQGAALRARLALRGERAMRLRQVVAVGETIEGGDPLFDLCPVWMASPETVAQVFPRQAMFDVIVFDEASQCRLEEALPVLTRGHRVVIAGDPRQLPPTRFFETAFTQSEEEEPETEQELFETQQGQVEDLLAAALNLSIQQCYLDVHYRSRNADLIGFSNQHFYNNRLQAIPGHPSRRSPFPPVALYRVNGIYSHRRNEIEAERVVQIVRELLEREDTPSIGIACFNLQQRDLIVEKLDDLASEDAAFAKILATAKARKGQGSFEGLFVKNLENVQGDERDHILISTTYGPDTRGKFYRRFGPLGRAGGGRRLNVLVTRAREQVHVVTSIPAEAYRHLPAIPEGQSAGGGWLLFAYLKYAEELTALYTAPPAACGFADPIISETDRVEPAKPQAVDQVDIHPTRAPSQFARELAKSIATGHHVGSDVHWGNEGFCVDLALHHPARPGDVTVGVLCDSCRYTAADDPVEWDIFRTGILADQGWTLRRVWTPHFFRDPVGNVDAILKDARAFVAESKEGEEAMMRANQAGEMTYSASNDPSGG